MTAAVAVRWTVAALHLLALGIGLGAIAARAAALGGPLDGAGLRRVFVADNLWGLAALLWVGTGVPRAFLGLEKGTAYYLASSAFLHKMGLFLAILVLEVWPMVTLIRWRMRSRSGEPLDTSRAALLSRMSWAQAALVILMVFAATAMARGLFI